MKTIFLTLMLLFTTITASACAPGDTNPAETAELPDVLAATTMPVLATSTPEPATLTPELASPTPVAANEAVYPTQVQYVLALVDVNLRGGPGVTYPIIGSVLGGS